MKFSKIEKQTRQFHLDAKIYDCINDFQSDVPFWVKWAKKAGPTVLELACGTGRIAVPLVKAGLEYAGVDISPSFLAAANQKLQSIQTVKKTKITKPPRLFHQDIRQFFIPRLFIYKGEKKGANIKAKQEKFDAIFIPFNAFQHLYQLEDAVLCLKAVKAHLKPKGIFIVEAHLPHPKFAMRDPHKKYPVLTFRKKGPNGGLNGSHDVAPFDLVESHSYDRFHQMNHITWYFKWKGQRKPQTLHLHMRSWYPQELRLLFEGQGFKVLHCFGSHKEAPCTTNSRSQIWVLKHA